VKLSEAILKGCEMVPTSGVGDVGCLVTLTDGTVVAACAGFAAVVGTYGPNQKDWPGGATGTSFIDLVALPTRHVTDCPVDACEYSTGQEEETIVAHLNDDHLWSREQIAAWLDEQGL
jgi:hypothetical protein